MRTIRTDHCLIDGCDGPGRAPGTARNLCFPHYTEFLRARPPKQCLVEDCTLSANRPGSARGYCSKHLYHVQQHGQPNMGRRLPHSATVEDRFDIKYTVNPITGCWEWGAGLTNIGYSQFSDGNTNVTGHSYAYRRYVGGVPKGLTLDHLCELKTCVNPQHLEPVTQSENNLRKRIRPLDKRIEGIIYPESRLTS